MAWQPSELELTETSDPHLRFNSFNQMITLEKPLEITSELIRATLNNMSLSCYPDNDCDYYCYKITKFDIDRASISCSILKLSEEKTVIGFNIILSYAKIPSYKLIYSILERIRPNISIPPMLRHKKLECCHNKPQPAIEIYIKMLESPFIDEINIALKGIAHSGCKKTDCPHYLSYGPYLNNILNISNAYQNPISEYKADIFTLSIYVISRILISLQMKDQCCQKHKYLPIVKKVAILSDEFCSKSTDDQCKYSCIRSINSLFEILIK